MNESNEMSVISDPVAKRSYDTAFLFLFLCKSNQMFHYFQSFSIPGCLVTRHIKQMFVYFWLHWISINSAKYYYANQTKCFIIYGLIQKVIRKLITNSFYIIQYISSQNFNYFWPHWILNTNKPLKELHLVLLHVLLVKRFWPRDC